MLLLSHMYFLFVLTDTKLEKNQVAGFLTLLRHMIQNSPVNQESLIRENAVATLATLLHKV